MRKFSLDDLKSLYIAPTNSGKMDNGQITVIGGSELFHGAPILALKSASRLVDMVYFASPEPSLSEAAMKLKSSLASFIWVPWVDLDKYILKSDAILIGPGFMRAGREDTANSKNPTRDSHYMQSREITKRLLTSFRNKKWVIDAGSLQVMDATWIPENSVLTPNAKEYEMLFGGSDPKKAAQKYNCTIVVKGPVSFVYSPEGEFEIHGGNAGLTKGGTGDVEAGLTAALLAKNTPLLSAAAAAFLVKRAAENIAEKSGIYYNSDDLAEHIGYAYQKFVLGGNWASFSA